MPTISSARIERWARPLVLTLVVVNVTVGVALRFMTTSKLWLDEAQAVNIAAKPLSQLPHYLRMDGAPPLYYIVLHYWMLLVGNSDFEVRALSGVVSVLTLVVSFYAARAWWDHRDAVLTLGVMAILPYYVYFATEARMYSFVMLLSVLLLLVLRWHLDRPRWTTTVGLISLATAMLYTHYWSIYFVGVLLAYALVRWWLHRRERDRRDLWLVGCFIVPFVLFLPWLPIFNEQRLHTGTPWAPAPTIYQLFTWWDGFTVNQSVPHVVASLHTQLTIMIFVGLFLFGVFGFAMTRDSVKVTLDPSGVPSTRTVSFIVLLTMAGGLLASHVFHSAYVPRYAAVVAVPIGFLVAKGVRNLETSLRILLVLGLFSAVSLWTDRWGVTDQRTEAGKVAAALVHVQPGALVFVCPDQLGPSLTRYANPTLTYLGYPRFENPSIVNWYDYKAAYKEHTPRENAAYAASLVTPHQRVFIVRSPGYGLKFTCLFFEERLATYLHRTMLPVVKASLGGYYQPMMLQELVAPRP